MKTIELNQATIEALIVRFGATYNDHARNAPSVGTPSNTLEALNALGWIVGTILAGTGNDRGAREFFERAVKMQVKHALREAVHMPNHGGTA